MSIALQMGPTIASYILTLALRIRHMHVLVNPLDCSIKVFQMQA